MEILEVIWQAFLHDLAQMPHNVLTPSISIPIISAVSWAMKHHWKPFAISLIAFGWGGIFYGFAGLIRLTPLFIDALRNVSNWDWSWIPTIVLHSIELLIGFGIWRLKSR